MYRVIVISGNIVGKEHRLLRSGFGDDNEFSTPKNIRYAEHGVCGLFVFRGVGVCTYHSPISPPNRRFQKEGATNLGTIAL